ncbi:heavy metal translocating P-type ATPase [Haloferula rosea]|uniref:Heavy metal translocating P-type ATPase metal-binding domain-containing protein n=1 Tax=Haloferula rosea TaxID=490093 RepID=A0A934VFC0_9BACT|nr:heavy metal translocating P-type ATPase metal-binding domain-containing protein [Haloferula rosea]MBK1826906.1 heavy metal translocating P-type ATPase metal-binding domain-containing protein [Haloferula rosea]
MPTCEHCGTAFSATKESDIYCCRGCEFVANMIRESGFERFYDLKQGLATAPVRSRPFEQHDFDWLDDLIEKGESSPGAAKLDCAIEGISCVGCVWLIEKLFDKHPGAIRAAAHPASGRLHLEWQAGHCDLRAFAEELTQFGYVIAPARRDAPDQEGRRLIGRLGLCGAFALNAMGFTLPTYLGMPEDFEFAGLFRLIAFLSATLAMLVGGSYFIDRAWRALQARSLHIDLPIALGLVTAYFGSIAGWALSIPGLHYFDFVATFVFLMLGGRYLQTAAVDRNRRRLLRSSPLPPSVQSDGKAIALEAIQPGMEYRIDPGQAVPVTSVIRAEQAEVSLEWINGEAEPVLKQAGSRLPAGAILLSRSALTLAAAEPWSDSLLSRLTATDTTERGSPILQQVLRYYLIVVLILGIAGLVVWISLGQPALGLQAMISVFVVSCPCALGVALPLADELAASRAERHGAFVRNATLWARLRQIRKVIFDKTGTLTLERPVLVDPSVVDGLDDDAARALAQLTVGSLHPVGRTLLEALGNRGQRLLSKGALPPLEETPGQGVTLTGEGTRWSLGRAGWAGDAADGSTSLCRDGERIAAFRFEDTLRPGAMESLDVLRRRRKELWILSGDTPDKVSDLAGRLGIPATHAKGGLSPTEKAERVQQLDQGDSLYLGDGANDSLAFDAATVTGTPVVDRSLLEAKADFYTLGSGLDFLPALFATADARAAGVRRAFAFALIYNAVAVSICLTGSMNPLLAAILMPLSSIVSVVLVARSGRRNFSSRS